MRQSRDAKVAKANVDVRGSRKLSVQRSINEAESRVKFKELVGTVRQGRRGLEVTNKARWSEASGKEKTDIVLSEVRAQEEERRRTKAVSMAGQGAWTRWESVTPRKLTWRDVLRMEPLATIFPPKKHIRCASITHKPKAMEVS